jgi:hypothetical protein
LLGSSGSQGATGTLCLGTPSAREPQEPWRRIAWLLVQNYIPFASFMKGGPKKCQEGEGYSMTEPRDVKYGGQGDALLGNFRSIKDGYQVDGRATRTYSLELQHLSSEIIDGRLYSQKDKGAYDAPKQSVPLAPSAVMLPNKASPWHPSATMLPNKASPWHPWHPCGTHVVKCDRYHRHRQLDLLTSVNNDSYHSILIGGR